MENVSQVLLMAAGMLIAIVIISMGVYLFSQAAELPSEYNDKLQKERLAAINSKFEAYNKVEISAGDIVTVINMAIENNRKYDISETDYIITIYLDGVEINNYTEAQKISMLEATEIIDEHLSYPYYCDKIEYSLNSGQVIKMWFKKD